MLRWRLGHSLSGVSPATRQDFGSPCRSGFPPPSAARLATASPISPIPRPQIRDDTPAPWCPRASSSANASLLLAPFLPSPHSPKNIPLSRSPFGTLSNSQPRRARRRRKPSSPPASIPTLFTRLFTCSRAATGSPWLRFRCTPTRSPGIARSNSTPLANALPFASREALVTIPLRCASAIPRFTPSVHPRSSAFTTRFLTLWPVPSLLPVLSASYSFVRNPHVYH